MPPPGFAAAQLRHHRDAYPPGPAGEVFTNLTGGPLRRTLFRSRVWRPALVTAGLLGRIESVGTGFRAVWTDAQGYECCADADNTRAAAVTLVVKNAAGGLRFHDLRHSYTTWLISSGVPVNDVQR